MNKYLFILLLILIVFTNLAFAKAIRLKDLSLKRARIGITVAPKPTPRLMDQLSLSKTGLSIKPQMEFFEKFYAEDFNIEETLKDLDVSRPPVEGKFIYQF
jgi:hypothetical protein